MVFYFVQRGETLYAIAKRYQTTVHAIVAANRLEDPNAICAGQALIIPRPGEVPSPPPGGIVHLVRPGETVFHLAAKFGTSAHDILKANQIAHPEFILPGQQLVVPERMEAAEDWPMLGRTPGRAGAGPVVLDGPPQEGWTFAPRKGLGVRPSAPVIRYERVYAGLGDGYFYCLDRNTARVKWRIPAADPNALAAMDGQALATPVVYDGLAYLCGPDGVVYAVDAYTGQQIWKVAVGGRITASPAALDGVVYLGCWDEHLYGLEAKTGAIAWKRHVGAPVTEPVAVGDEHVYAITPEGTVWALDAQTGAVSWQAAALAGTAPVFADVVVLAGDRALDPKTGHQLWQIETAGASPIARLDQVIYPGGVVDLFTGTLRPLTLPGATGTNPPAAALEEAVAEQVAAGVETEAESPPAVPPARVPLLTHVASGSLMLGIGEDQHLHAWNLSDGTIAWTVSLPAVADHPPAVAVGQVVVALANGTLCSYRFKASSK